MLRVDMLGAAVVKGLACLLAAAEPGALAGAMVAPAGAPVPQDARRGAPQEPTAVATESWSFQEQAPDCGIDFRHRFGGDRFRCILEDTGSGVAVFDHDGDGLLDVYLVNGGWVAGVHAAPGDGQRGAMNRLYRNLGGMRFVDVTAQAGVGDTGYGMGVAVGDHDNDGDEDLYVLNYGANVFYRNEGAGRFLDVTAALGLAGPPMLAGGLKWSVNGTFFDADGDRDLDLYVANYLAFDPELLAAAAPGEPYAGPESLPAQRSILYRNEGERFVDVTDAAGFGGDDIKSMGATLADFDGDGSLDLFEAGDTVPNTLFRREQGDHWSEVGVMAGIALDRSGTIMSSMHGSAGDFDGDGRLDLFVSNLEHGCLYRNLGDLAFEEVSRRTGVAAALRGLAGWGSEFGDFDLDGDLDLLVVNGGAFSAEDSQPIKMLLNDGDGRFTDVSQTLGPDFGKMVGRGVAAGDLDGDGDLDLVINRKDRGGLCSVLRNDLPAGRHWLLVNLIGVESNRDAIGARLTLRAGGRPQVREVQRSMSYLSQNDRRVHFGLGDAAAPVELEIRWPSGRTQVLSVAQLDQVLTVLEPDL